MHFKRHSHLEGEHAFLSPSQHHWVNYDSAKLEHRWYTSQALAMGIEHHAYAAYAIEHGIWQSDESILLGKYINDCIRHKMQSEVVLFYSDNCFGTADAISFRYMKLRIFDLKTGQTPASVQQVEIYAALFCLEYDIDPYEIKMEFRIYQYNEAQLFTGDPATIEFIMKKIIIFDHRVNFLKRKEGVS